MLDNIEVRKFLYSALFELITNENAPFCDVFSYLSPSMLQQWIVVQL